NRFRAYYNDGRSNTIGLEGFAMIQDFRRDDKIQLHGKASDYRIGSAPRGGKNASGIFLKTPGQDELIAIVKGDTGPLNSQSFTFV
ncbi:MAG: type I secretion protein, partial [Cyanobacteria bacterium J06631_9]